ncbi:DUF3732 domain-containing protein [Ralstonia sp. 24A2]|uniref:DUF3732 domain-containing protein n=1 Tax=Ralstonia sp. 24A2 TaxID=3447364 RepID=UPI003F69CBAA
MKLQIIEIILWPRKGEFEPRRVIFKPKKANIITGASKTGKSSIIPIIDYCLASDRCSIPVGIIRQAVSWFGILVETDEGQKLLARPEPGRQPSAQEMFVIEADKVSIPRSIAAANTNFKQVKATLDRLARLTKLGTDVENQDSGYAGRPSFRDLMAFCFQPQNVVANPDVLFYRADTTEHREKLRAIFPYVLGAITPESLEKQWEVDRLRRELRVKRREADAYEQASRTWTANISNWVAEAYELGLVKKDALERKQEAELLSLLNSLVRQGVPERPISAEAMEESALEYASLQVEESNLNTELTEVRHRLNRLAELRGSVSQYKLSLDKRKGRLSLSRWLRSQAHDSDQNSCPVCAQSLSSQTAVVDVMCDALAVVESDARRASQAPAVFDRDWNILNKTLHELTDKLGAVSVRRRGIEQRSARAKQQRLLTNQTARFLGAIEQALVLYNARANTGADKAIRDIESRIQSLLTEIGRENFEARLVEALKRLSKSMEKLSSKLDAEDPAAWLQLDTKELTVRVGGAEGRNDYLWQLGSGANWLTYHVASTLALHALFLAQKNSPVPGLMVYDQPSQVYFPRKLASRHSDDDDPKIPDEDTDAVRRFFDVFGKATSTFKGGDFQIIVVDHAGREIWDGLKGIHVVEEWRNGKKLVPEAWIDAVSSNGTADTKD